MRTRRDVNRPTGGRITAREIRERVRAVFDAVAERPGGTFPFSHGPALARRIGYPDEALASVPRAASESFTGLAYLHPYLALEPGEHVLDLGSGGGLDAILAAQAVGPAGSVTGLDFAGSMVEKATAVAARLGISNVTFVQGAAEAMPFPDETFDAVLVNGLLNLCPDKAVVAHELFRVLKPGGRAVVAEISLAGPLPRTEIRAADDWFGGLDGALPEAALLAIFEHCGFSALTVLSRHRNEQTRTPGTYVVVLGLRKPA